MIHLSLGCCSTVLQIWNDVKWMELGKEDQPPDLCLVNNAETKGDKCFEYYRCPVSLPFKENDNIVALFQSSRDENEKNNNWEYHENILLYYKDDF